MFQYNTFNATQIDEFKLIDRNIQPTEVITVSDWLEGAYSPTYVRKQDSFKAVQLTYLLEAQSEVEAQLAISELIKRFTSREYDSIEFSDIPDYIYPFVYNSSKMERLKPSVYKVTVSLKCAYMVAKQISTFSQDSLIANTEFSINNEERYTIPYCLSIITKPTAAIVEINVYSSESGNKQDRLFTLANIPADSTLEVDGIANTITITNNSTGGVGQGIDCYRNTWSMPVLQPGVNKFQVDYATGYQLKANWYNRYY